MLKKSAAKTAADHLFFLVFNCLIDGNASHHNECDGDDDLYGSVHFLHTSNLSFFDNILPYLHDNDNINNLRNCPKITFVTIYTPP